MSCKKCGRESGHYIGCLAAQPQASGHDLHNEGHAEEDRCDFDGCTEPKKPWSGRGARPKFCAAGHKKEK